MKIILLAIFAIFAFSPTATAQSRTGVRGDEKAVSAAQRVLENAGGAAPWSKRMFSVKERAYLRNGEVAELEIARDFETGSRLLIRKSNTVSFTEWVSQGEGWVVRNGVRRAMSIAEHAAERYGLAQEPYAVYHRLAKGDAGLRAELRSDGALLYVYDQNERLLCWFNLDGAGKVYGWGNFFDGSINQHFYGPYGEFGGGQLPKWGSANDGRFRFEYLSAKFSDSPLTEPTGAD